METMQVFGVKPNGSTDLIGTAPISHTMKMKDIVRNYIGEPSDDPDCNDEATTCLWALRDYHHWLLSQGWIAPKLVVTPNAM